MSKKNQVSYQKPDPPFLRRIREQVGYQEITDIDTKKQTLDRPNDLEDQDDEKPTVVITENSNVTKEEQEDFAEKLTEVKPAKILFKKPVKKSDDTAKEGESTGEEKNQVTRQTGLKRSLEEARSKDKEEDKSKKPKQKEKSSRLLSFGEDDDDEEF